MAKAIVTKSRLIDAKHLGPRIQAWAAINRQSDFDVHILACSAVQQAGVHGRPDWLNDLYMVMSPMQQAYFKSWLHPNAAVWNEPMADEKKNPLRKLEDVQWLEFKDGKFLVKKGTDAIRPKAEKCEAIAADYDKYSMSKQFVARVAANVQSWDKFLEGTIDRALKEIAKRRDNGEGIPDQVVESLQSTKTALAQLASLTARKEETVVNHPAATKAAKPSKAQRQAKMAKAPTAATEETRAA